MTARPETVTQNPTAEWLLQRQPFWHSPYSEPDAGAGAVHTITVDSDHTAAMDQIATEILDCS